MHRDVRYFLPYFPAIAGYIRCNLKRSNRCYVFDDLPVFAKFLFSSACHIDEMAKVAGTKPFSNHTTLELLISVSNPLPVKGSLSSLF